MGRGDLSITQLFFVDDSILFGEASLECLNNMKETIKKYEGVSGQPVNFDKSLIYCSKGIADEVKMQLGEILGVPISNNLERHPGLPTMIGRRKKGAFIELKENFLQKIESRSCRNLSIGGKEVFVKSVLQAQPIYFMQCFKLPLTICKEFKNIMSRFG